MKPWDHRALEGMPLKLLIMSLLIALTVPAVIGSMDGFERSTARTMLEAEASRLGRVVEEVVTAGEGNRRVADISIPLSAARYALSLEIGGDVNSTSSMAVRCCADGVAYSTLFLTDPPARATSAEGASLQLEAGEHRLMVECKEVEGRLAAVVSVIQ